MGFFTPDYFIHAANILLLIAYSVRDVLWLRLFAVAASLIAIPYYVLQPTMLWAPLAWSVVFAANQSISIVAALYRASSSQTDGRGRGNSPACLSGLTASESPAGSEHWILGHG